MHNLGVEQTVSPSDTSSNYLRTLITMLNPAPSSAPATDTDASWVINPYQGDMSNNTNSADPWSNPALDDFGDTIPRQDFDLQWNFDIQ